MLDKFVDNAISLRNVPYADLGYTDKGLDCVGLVAKSAYDTGLLPEEYWQKVKLNKNKVARNRDLYEALCSLCDKAPFDSIKRGDILIFNVARVAHPTHLAIALGGGLIIQASNIHKKVVINNFVDTLETKLIGVFRIK